MLFDKLIIDKSTCSGLHKTDCVGGVYVSTYSLVQVDGVFAGDDVVDGATLGGCGFSAGGGLLVSLGHCCCIEISV